MVGAGHVRLLVARSRTLALSFPDFSMDAEWRL